MFPLVPLRNFFWEGSDAPWSYFSWGSLIRFSSKLLRLIFLAINVQYLCIFCQAVFVTIFFMSQVFEQILFCSCKSLVCCYLEKVECGPTNLESSALNVNITRFGFPGLSDMYLFTEAWKGKELKFSEKTLMKKGTCLELSTTKKIWPKWLFNYYRKCMYIYKCSTFSPPNLWQSTLVLLFTKFLASCSCPSVSPMPGASTTSTDRSFLLRGFLAVKVYSTVSLFLVWRKGASLEQFEFSTVQF